jgi:N,N-dimethylformamidase
MEENIDHDTFTDEDLHRDGLELLKNYRVIITGSHPEYYSKRMIVAIETYLKRGGNVCLLGAEFGYWVTSVCPQNRAIMEVRRGESGSRTQSALPGEYHHSSTGELGGLWRYRGHSAHTIVGVGFTAWGHEKGAGYRRLPASHDPRAAFIFDGIAADEIIGDFGFVLGGAAGYEMDRFDFSLGTPPHALLLATSEGMHSSKYFPAVEDIMDTATIDAISSKSIRADMVFFETGAGGAVFSTGSITWTGSLSHNGYKNNVATITRNVVRRFSSGDPFALVN